MAGFVVLFLSFMAEIWLFHNTLSDHQRFEAQRALNLIEGRLAGYLELLAVLSEVPPYLKNLAWLTDELQGDPGLTGVLVKEGKRVLLNTFPEDIRLDKETFLACRKGYEYQRAFFLCRNSELAPGKNFFLLVAFDTHFKALLFREALVYGGLVFLGGSLLLLLAALYTQKLEKERENLRERLISSERLATMGRLSAMIAHEIRNPLNTLFMGIQYLKEAENSEEILPLLEDEIRRLSELTGELLSLSRGFEVKIEKFELSELLSQIEVRFRPKIEAKGLAFRISAPEKLVLTADRRWLYRALANLLTNAIEHAPVGESVEVSISAQKRQIVFQVCNSGSTVPKALKGKIFEPFFTTREGGFGLGLYIVKQVAEAHGGRVGLKTFPEKVCFEMEIPGESTSL
ncbi:Two-component sensor PilS [Thermosulfurimonas dismutans]|uniref:histidine kinase n=1 Tax=Thermosulfurimonas dismutans TaxID=999894 RepID=A0A179D5I0_9BACT|nr:Two-component sensor PilS [Thermosulfurimonas dismutans]